MTACLNPYTPDLEFVSLELGRMYGLGLYVKWILLDHGTTVVGITVHQYHSGKVLRRCVVNTHKWAIQPNTPIYMKFFPHTLGTMCSCWSSWYRSRHTSSNGGSRNLDNRYLIQPSRMGRDCRAMHSGDRYIAATHQGAVSSVS